MGRTASRRACNAANRSLNLKRLDDGAEGKNLSQMTDTQRKGTHACGIMNRQHCDGWDGNWLDCAEAKRRGGSRAY